jgi:hypothetical protein
MPRESDDARIITFSPVESLRILNMFWVDVIAALRLTDLSLPTPRLTPWATERLPRYGF